MLKQLFFGSIHHRDRMPKKLCEQNELINSKKVKFSIKHHKQNAPKSSWSYLPSSSKTFSSLVDWILSEKALFPSGKRTFLTVLLKLKQTTVKQVWNYLICH